MDLEQILLDSGGILLRREHRALGSRITRWAAAGLLYPVLPGVYLPAAARGDVRLLAEAAQRWAPESVIVGAAAAKLAFWPALPVDRIELATRHRRTTRPGFRILRRVIPAECVLVSAGIRLTVPALTALDLVDSHGGAGIDRALLTRAATLARMHEVLALSACRSGNVRRRLMLADSRNEPWSEAERLLHRLLRSAGITGWSANRPVRCGSQVVVPDVAFRRQRIALEVDGYEYHSDRASFEWDRRRQNLLVLAGWQVLRFTWVMVSDDPGRVIAEVRSALHRSARQIA